MYLKEDMKNNCKSQTNIEEKWKRFRVPHKQALTIQNILNSNCVRGMKNLDN